MSFLPDMNIGWEHAWWFPAVYALITIVISLIYGKTFVKKFLRFPKSTSLKGKILTTLSATLFGRALMIYSIFIPLRTDTVWFWIGIVIFVTGAILTTIAMINFARTPHDQPVTQGMYRVSRHPVQILAIFMWLGVSAATMSWIIAAACVLLLVVYYPAFLIQERSCSDLYGITYDEYVKATPRYLFI